MTIWTIPTPAVLTVIVGLLYLGLLSRRVQTVAYNIATHLGEKEGTGVSSSSVGGWSGRLSPPWTAYLLWGTTLAALILLFYVGFRYGIWWALAYGGLDHLLKSLNIPILPTLSQSYAMVKAQAQKQAPELVKHIEAHQDDYVH